MPTFVPYNRGWIEAITGPMFSGKSEELIRRLTRAQIAKQTVAVFKPAVDDRFSISEIVSRSGARIDCKRLDSFSLADMLAECLNGDAPAADVFGFDEAQFFEDSLLPQVCIALAFIGKRVIVAGLDTDFRGVPFRTMADMLAGADFVDKLNAVCMVCGDVATKTARIVDSEDRVVVGDTESYMAMCRTCHTKHYLGDGLCSNLEKKTEV